MVSLPEPSALAQVRAQLLAVSEQTQALEETLFAVLPVTGSPGVQQAVDNWVDQAADTLRACGARAEEEDLRLGVVSRQLDGVNGSVEEAAAWLAHEQAQGWAR